MDLNIFRYCDTCGHSTLWSSTGNNTAVCGRCFKTKIIKETSNPKQRTTDKYSETDKLFDGLLKG